MTRRRLATLQFVAEQQAITVTRTSIVVISIIIISSSNSSSIITILSIINIIISV